MNKVKSFLEISEDGDNLDSIFPVKAQSGQIEGANGKWLIRVNRERDDSPLTSPVDRDGLIHYIADHLNHNQGDVKDFIKRYRKS
jgi:hypothetical protein